MSENFIFIISSYLDSSNHNHPSNGWFDQGL